MLRSTISKLKAGKISEISAYEFQRQVQKFWPSTYSVELLNRHGKALDNLGTPIRFGGIRWNKRKINYLSDCLSVLAYCNSSIIAQLFQLASEPRT
ncbi:hypothetical protein TTRE_0000370901 [Trichuris trichiura]|uniref:Uncharacterized protein n=1 Tax=Trichuris trichiura TaxID=36087 RepID=A0A077Z4M4_TRITR|nr:hypothetical protein TTRE_0000370901 [Trichuris trichiura]